MFKSKLFQSIKGVTLLRKYGFEHKPIENFELKRALLVTKLSRYESEKQKYPHLSDNQLEEFIRNRGTDYDALLHSHYIQKEFEKKIATSFKKVGVEIRITNRVEFRTSPSKDILRWANLLVPVGGDGTFLLTAGRASPLVASNQHRIPIVGFNSDPARSEGRLMLPKEYSENPDDAVQRIVSGNFRWMHRTRIRTSLLTNNGKTPESIDLHGHTISRMEQEQTAPEMLSEKYSKKYKAVMKRVLPYLALNEVFIGETLSARVSLLQLMVDDLDTVNKTKCSGLCVSTGTGSTSWHHSINRLSTQHVEDLLKILGGKQQSLADANPDHVAEQYNQNLLFPPDDSRLCYSIREQICVGVWPIPKGFPSRNFVKKLYVKSKCIDASLVIDGSIAYPFNDGAKVLLEVYPEDALVTIALD